MTSVLELAEVVAESAQPPKVPMCKRCDKSENPRPREPGDFMCKVCRKLQKEVSAIAVDPCDKLLLMILGDDRTRQEVAKKYPRAKPVGPKKLAGIRLAMAGKGGTDDIRNLVAQLLPGERKLVLGAMSERASAPAPTRVRRVVVQ
jgi:hypothetical protein